MGGKVKDVSSVFLLFERKSFSEHCYFTWESENQWCQMTHFCLNKREKHGFTVMLGPVIKFLFTLLLLLNQASDNYFVK